MNVFSSHRTHSLRALLALPALLALSSLAGAQAPQAIVQIGSASREATTPTAALPGTVISTRDAQVRAELASRIEWIAQVGAEIMAGEPLARLDDHLLRLQLRSDEARIERLKADIAVRERQLGRLERLAAENNMAQMELDQVEADVEMLRQDLAIAVVEKERTAYDLQRARVPAPFSGIVVARSMSEGEYTGVGSTLVRLVDMQALEISVPAPLRVARFNRPGAEVDIHSEAGDSTEQVRSVVPVGDPQSRLMELRITANSDHWLIGEAVTVSLPQAEPVVALTVPRDALVLRDREQFVYTVDYAGNAEGRARKVTVQTTGGIGSRVAVKVISGNLGDGAPVIVRGAENLRDGQDVRVTGASAERVVNSSLALQAPTARAAG